MSTQLHWLRCISCKGTDKVSYLHGSAPKPRLLAIADPTMIPKSEPLYMTLFFLMQRHCDYNQFHINMWVSHGIITKLPKLPKRLFLWLL